MHIAFLISTLRAGGAERVVARLANARVAAGRATSVVTLEGTSGDFHSLDARVQRVALGRLRATRTPFGAITANLGRLGAIRHAVATLRPDVIVSFVDQMNVLSLAAMMGATTAHVVSERIDPRECSPGRGWAALRRLLYPRADAVVVQTESVAAWARRVHPSWHVHVIPNPIDAPPAVQAAARRNVIVGMGRLVPQKGFDLLLDAFARVAPEHPTWSLIIAGEGPDRPRLERQARELGIADVVQMPGTVPAAELLAQAGIFALSSRFEGFPNVLLEAMATGAPAVAFDCPSGPADIIRPGIDGMLVPHLDVGALAAALDSLIRSPGERQRMGTIAPEVSERFGMDVVLAEWEQVFHDVTGRA